MTRSEGGDDRERGYDTKNMPWQPLLALYCTPNQVPLAREPRFIQEDDDGCRYLILPEILKIGRVSATYRYCSRWTILESGTATVSSRGGCRD